MLIDRENELAELNLLLEEPGAHLLAVSGRRRLGKTTLLLEWARRSGRPFLYWVASRAPAPLLLRQFSQDVWRQAHPGDIVPATFSFDHWADAFEQVARLAADRRYIVILDEFPYAAEADSALPSILQNAWDHHLKTTSVVTVDVVAVGWRERAILLGECKWGVKPVSRDVVRELIEKKTPKLLQRLPGEAGDWTVRYAFFARAGFTEAARAMAQPHGALLVDLDTLGRDLGATA